MALESYESWKKRNPNGTKADFDFLAGNNVTKRAANMYRAAGELQNYAGKIGYGLETPEKFQNTLYQDYYVKGIPAEEGVALYKKYYEDDGNKDFYNQFNKQAAQKFADERLRLGKQGIEYKAPKTREELYENFKRSGVKEDLRNFDMYQYGKDLYNAGKITYDQFRNQDYNKDIGQWDDATKMKYFRTPDSTMEYMAGSNLAKEELSKEVVDNLYKAKVINDKQYEEFKKIADANTPNWIQKAFGLSGDTGVLDGLITLVNRIGKAVYTAPKDKYLDNVDDSFLDIIGNSFAALGGKYDNISADDVYLKNLAQGSNRALEEFEKDYKYDPEKELWYTEYSSPVQNGNEDIRLSQRETKRRYFKTKEEALKEHSKKYERSEELSNFIPDILGAGLTGGGNLAAKAGMEGLGKTLKVGGRVVGENALLPASLAVEGSLKGIGAAGKASMEALDKANPALAAKIRDNKFIESILPANLSRHGIDGSGLTYLGKDMDDVVREAGQGAGGLRKELDMRNKEALEALAEESGLTDKALKKEAGSRIGSKEFEALKAEKNDQLIRDIESQQVTKSRYGQKHDIDEVLAKQAELETKRIADKTELEAKLAKQLDDYKQAYNADLSHLKADHIPKQAFEAMRKDIQALKERNIDVLRKYGLDDQANILERAAASGTKLPADIKKMLDDDIMGTINAAKRTVVQNEKAARQAIKETYDQLRKIDFDKSYKVSTALLQKAEKVGSERAAALAKTATDKAEKTTQANIRAGMIAEKQGKLLSDLAKQEGVGFEPFTGYFPHLNKPQTKTSIKASKDEIKNSSVGYSALERKDPRSFHQKELADAGKLEGNALKAYNKAFGGLAHDIPLAKFHNQTIFENTTGKNFFISKNRAKAGGKFSEKGAKEYNLVNAGAFSMKDFEGAGSQRLRDFVKKETGMELEAYLKKNKIKIKDLGKMEKHQLAKLDVIQGYTTPQFYNQAEKLKHQQVGKWEKMFLKNPVGRTLTVISNLFKGTAVATVSGSTRDLVGGVMLNKMVGGMTNKDLLKYHLDAAESMMKNLEGKNAFNKVRMMQEVGLDHMDETYKAFITRMQGSQSFDTLSELSNSTFQKKGKIEKVGDAMLGGRGKNTYSPYAMLLNSKRAGDDVARFALFQFNVDKLTKGKDFRSLTFKEQESIYNKAAIEVKKVHRPYGELPGFEKVLSKIIPFYDWGRMHTPNMIKGLATNTHTAANIAKVQGRSLHYSGVQDDDSVRGEGRLFSTFGVGAGTFNFQLPLDPFDQPSFKGVTGLAKTASKMVSGKKVNLDSKEMREMVNSAGNPFAKVLYTALTGRDAFTNKEMKHKPVGLLAQVLPPLSRFYQEGKKGSGIFPMMMAASGMDFQNLAKTLNDDSERALKKLYKENERTDKMIKMAEELSGVKLDPKMWTDQKLQERKRNYEATKKEWSEKGFGDYFEEIEKWLKDHPEESKYAGLFVDPPMFPAYAKNPASVKSYEDRVKGHEWSKGALKEAEALDKANTAAYEEVNKLYNGSTVLEDILSGQKPNGSSYNEMKKNKWNKNKEKIDGIYESIQVNKDKKSALYDQKRAYERLNRKNYEGYMNSRGKSPKPLSAKGKQYLYGKPKEDYRTQKEQMMDALGPEYFDLLFRK
ncbi:hypothetical protein ABNF65_02615 [Paenibacillus larvae]